MIDTIPRTETPISALSAPVLAYLGMASGRVYYAPGCAPPEAKSTPRGVVVRVGFGWALARFGELANEEAAQ